MPRITMNQLIRENPAELEDYQTRVDRLRELFDTKLRYGAKSQMARDIGSTPAWVGSVLNFPREGRTSKGNRAMPIISPSTVRRIERWLEKHQNEWQAEEDQVTVNQEYSNGALASSA